MSANPSARRTRKLLIAGAVLVSLATAVIWQRVNPFRIDTSIVIDAPPERVWAELTDFASYGDWNPTLSGMRGDLVEGGTLTFRTDASEDAMTFEPTVLEVDPPFVLRWEGKLWAPGLFDGEHQFVLTETADGGTRLVQREDFRGILVPFLTRYLTDTTEPDFRAMNEALRVRIENG